MSTVVDLTRRFAGLDRLWGAVGAQSVRDAHVAVVGVGGVGSWTVEALARSGVGRISLIDLDQVAESNINRQIQALDSTLGMSKVGALQQRVAQINPECRVDVIEDWISPENCSDLLAALVSPLHGLIDACDQVKAKVALAQWAGVRGVCFVGVGAAGGKVAAHRVDIADLDSITHDPLLAKVRQGLRRQLNASTAAGRPMGWKYVYSPESVLRPKRADRTEAGGFDATLNCSGYGSLVSVTATFGMCAAGWVLQQIAQSGADAMKTQNRR